MALIRGLALVAAGLALVGCSTTQSIHPRPRDAAQFAPWSDAPTVFRLGWGDKIKVRYLHTPELDQEVMVDPDGYVGLTAAERVLVQGRTLAEAQAAIEQASRANLRDPVVAVSVVEAKSARIVVAGAVRTPGVYLMSARASVMELIAQAGGFRDESRMDEVVIIRQRPGQAPMLRTLDLQRFVAAGDASGSVALAPEDIIFVPRSHIAEADLWVDENITKLLPFSRSLNYDYGKTVGAIRP